MAKKDEDVIEDEDFDDSPGAGNEDKQAEEENAQEEGEQTDESKDPPKPEPEEYDNTNLKIEDVMNIGYVEDEETKKHLNSFVDALKSTTVHVKIASKHDMSVVKGGKQVLKVCPLKKGLSASINGGKVCRHKPEDILNFIKQDFPTDFKPQVTG